MAAGLTDRAYAVSLHDVAPATWNDCVVLLELLRPFAIPVTLLVVPHFHRGTLVTASPPFLAALRARVALGDEVVLHGYCHRDEGPRSRSLRQAFARRFLTAGEGEFAALPADEATRRLDAGRTMLDAAGLAPRGFVAPAWQLGPAARTALAASGLDYTCDRDRLYALPGYAPVVAPSLVYSTRAAWRRTVSRYWNRRRLRALAGERYVRVALHPAEARYPGVLAEWRTLIGSLAAGRRPALESHWLG